MPKKDIFISHAWKKDLLGRDNHKRCKKLCDKLKNFGYNTWFDEYDMGRDIDNSIMNAIDNCKVFIVCLTEEYCNKINNAVKYNKINDNCYKEWNYAVNRNKIIIPVIMEPDVLNTFKNGGILSMYLSSIIYINMSVDNQEEFKKLCKRLKSYSVRTKLQNKLMKSFSYNKLIKTIHFKKIKGKHNIIYI